MTATLKFLFSDKKSDFKALGICSSNYSKKKETCEI